MCIKTDAHQVKPCVYLQCRSLWCLLSKRFTSLPILQPMLQLSPLPPLACLSHFQETQKKPKDSLPGPHVQNPVHCPLPTAGSTPLFWPLLSGFLCMFTVQHSLVPRPPCIPLNPEASTVNPAVLVSLAEMLPCCILHVPLVCWPQQHWFESKRSRSWGVEASLQHSVYLASSLSHWIQPHSTALDPKPADSA